jgi:hypothetical protein
MKDDSRRDSKFITDLGITAPHLSDIWRSLCLYGDDVIDLCAVCCDLNTRGSNPEGRYSKFCVAILGVCE